MPERSKDDILLTEEQIGIKFVSANETLLNELSFQLHRVSNQLGNPIREVQTPPRGFVEKTLSKSQEQAVGQLLEVEYAQSAVNLQDRLINIPVRETGERMVYLPMLFEKNNVKLSLSRLPFHEACGDWAGKERVFWAREQVANRILVAGRALEAIGIQLHIEDAFRPVGVQEGLFLRRAKLILKENPDWIEDWDKVWVEARSKTAITPLMAGHKSGAALDRTLKRISDGSSLAIGNQYPEGGAKVALDYPYLTQKEWSNRQLFIQTMDMAGLGIYPYETWHVSFGDLSAGIQVFSGTNSTPDYEAIYGPIKEFNHLTGEVQPYSPDNCNQPFFTPAELLDLVRA